MVKPLLGVDPIPKIMENTKSPTQDFINFAIKIYLEKNQNSHNYMLFSHVFVRFY